MSQSMAIANMKKARASFAKVYPAFGKYRWEVQALKIAFPEAGGMFGVLELKVLKAEKTHDNEPNPVGCTVSFVQDLMDIKKGGPGRFKAALIGLFGVTEQQADDMLEKLTHETKCPGVFLPVDGIVTPKQLKEKNGKPGITVEAITWLNVDLGDAALAEVNAKRAAVQLPPLPDALA